MPRLAATRLTDAGIQKLRPPAMGRKEHFDAVVSGLSLRIGSNDRRVWAFTKNSKALGYIRLTLGEYPAMGLADARRAAGDALDQLKLGIDPREERRALHSAAPETPTLTYEQAVDEYIEKYQRGKKRNRRADEVRRYLRHDCEAWLKRPVNAVSRRDVFVVLDGIMARGSPYSANRTYAALKTFFRWAHERDHVDSDPMDRIRKPFDGEVTRERHWTDEEIKVLWQTADALGPIMGGYLKILMLLGQRRGEVASMRRTDLEERDGRMIWRLSAANAKNEREHRFPLPKLAERIIRTMPEIAGTDLVFPGRTRTQPFNGWSKLQKRIQTKSGIADFGFHQSRHTLRTGLDRLGIRPDIKERCLGHVPQTIGDRHYSHYDYVPEMHDAFETWAQHVEQAVFGMGIEALR